MIILLNGQVRADARLSDLATTSDVVLVLAQGEPKARDALVAIPGVTQVDVEWVPDGQAYRIQGGDGRDLRPAVYELARDEGWALRELRRDVRTLETVFNELVTAAEGDPESFKEDDAA